MLTELELRAAEPHADTLAARRDRRLPGAPVTDPHRRERSILELPRAAAANRERERVAAVDGQPAATPAPGVRPGDFGDDLRQSPDLAAGGTGERRRHRHVPDQDGATLRGEIGGDAEQGPTLAAAERHRKAHRHLVVAAEI